MIFGERLKGLRKERNITQDELGTIIGLSGRAIGYYETGERFPPEDILNKIADYFDVTMDYLLGRPDRRDPTIIENLNSLSPEERSAVEIMIRTLASAKKEQSAVGI